MSKPRYTPREELANSSSHGLGLVASIVGLGLLVHSAAIHGDGWRVAAVAVFSASMVLLYLTSTLYHAVPGARAKGVLRRLDHAAIYLLIAGTYTPVALEVLGGRRGLALLVAIWTLAAVGIASDLLLRRRWLSLTIYLAMGWLVVVVAGPLAAALDTTALALIVGGGVSYTAGVPFYLWRSLPFHHLVWHLFVLAGSALHGLAIFLAVARA